jgi:predicted lipid carrier protein YhbT
MASSSTSLSPSEPLRVQPASLSDVLEWLRKNFRAERSADLRVTYQFELTGPQGGCLWARAQDGQLEAGDGSVADPDVVFRVAAVDFFGVLGGVANPDLLFMERKLEVEGDLSLALKLRSLFSESG